jgi:glutathione peroxidase
MKNYALPFILLMLLAAMPLKSIFDFTMKDIDGKDVSLGLYKGKVLLIVNVASLCGNTPQYKDIEALYEKYKDKGLVVLGFPENNFMGQEPGSNEEIKKFCTSKYDVKFPMFAKISVKGKDMAPLYKYLTEKSENNVIDAPVQWNFQKFLISKDGNVITSFAPKKQVTDPEVIASIEKALQ